jgi:hypothetical protein
MIFLAVSAFMFVVAAYFIQGKQANAEFNQAMQAINSSMQKVINNVNDNNYPPINLACSSNGSKNQPLTITTATSNQQGTNLGCVFLGEVVQFGVKGTNGQGYNVYRVAGCEYVDSSVSGNCINSTGSTSGFISGQPPTSFNDAYATVIDPGVDNCAFTGGNGNVTVNLTSCKTLQWGIYATAMYEYQSSPGRPGLPTTGTIMNTNSIGFFNSFAQQNQTSSGGGLLPGSQNINIVDPGKGINIDYPNTPSPNNNLDEKGMVLQINNYLNNSNVEYIANPYFVVCFSDGRGHVGALVIGGGAPSSNGVSTDQRLSTSVKISDTTIYPFGNGINSQYSCQP